MNKSAAINCKIGLNIYPKVIFLRKNVDNIFRLCYNMGKNVHRIEYSVYNFGEFPPPLFYYSDGASSFPRRFIIAVLCSIRECA